MTLPLKTPAPAHPGKRRCDNCPKFFTRDPKQPKKRFCSEACRKEFHRFGAGYGPLKDKLEKLIATSSKEAAAVAIRNAAADEQFRRALSDAGFIHRSQLGKFVQRFHALEDLVKSLAVATAAK